MAFLVAELFPALVHGRSEAFETLLDGAVERVFGFGVLCHVVGLLEVPGGEELMRNKRDVIARIIPAAGDGVVRVLAGVVVKKGEERGNGGAAFWWRAVLQRGYAPCDENEEWDGGANGDEAIAQTFCHTALGHGRSYRHRRSRNRCRVQ